MVLPFTSLPLLLRLISRQAIGLIFHARSKRYRNNVEAVQFAPDGNETLDGVCVVEKALDGIIKGLCYSLYCVNAGQTVEAYKEAAGWDEYADNIRAIKKLIIKTPTNHIFLPTPPVVAPDTCVSPSGRHD